MTNKSKIVYHNPITEQDMTKSEYSLFNKALQFQKKYFQDIEDVIVMNISEDARRFMPKTYVDFYILNNEYNVGFELFRVLTHKFGSLIYCSVEFESDFNKIDECSLEDNGYINLRFSLEIYEPHELHYPKLQLYRDIINEICMFRKVIKKSSF